MRVGGAHTFGKPLAATGRFTWRPAALAPASASGLYLFSAPPHPQPKKTTSARRGWGASRPVWRVAYTRSRSGYSSCKRSSAIHAALIASGAAA
jgi:hypothetical protein